MLIKPEKYKGISFIRISSLPGEQKSSIKQNYNREGVVKILKDNSLLNDCIIYDDYVKWYNQFIETLERNDMIMATQGDISSMELVKK
jgi:hypothetical protein